MTNEELIARLRDKNCCESPSCNCDAAADRIEELEKENTALKEHVAALLAEQECGCGYDKPTDVCLGHLPLHRKTMARAERLEAALREIEADCDADYPPSHGAIKQAARAALKGEDHE